MVMPSLRRGLESPNYAHAVKGRLAASRGRLTSPSIICQSLFATVLSHCSILGAKLLRMTMDRH